MRFSQRRGLVPTGKILQIDSIDEDLKNSLWSVLTAFYWEKFDRFRSDMGERTDYISGSNLYRLFNSLWLYFFKKPIDTIPTYFYDETDGLGVLRKYFFSAKWHEIYDFIEFVVEYGPELQKEGFIAACNYFLERESSAYRFVDGKIAEISSPDEIAEIEDAISKTTPYYGVRQHLSTAISMLSDRANPDYRNSIKESISAVESLCRTVSGQEKATLGAALKTLESKGLMHPALKSAFCSLYGYTNDSDGIRHALMKESNLTSADARFMLISCSAFINYVIASISNG
ncbi:AbiJ-NTD4 domain-containing protein [Pseudomonas sp. EL_65y_Pfl2_R95]|uniref:AbiJ-NTD4 domain-containing protein n=1 Tax=Pseudomonas sp. EL_65y_Pfl2_R95 TaxID=3088698 RepID=UPI0030D73411